MPEKKLHYRLSENFSEKIKLPKRLEFLLNKSFEVFLPDDEWREFREGLIKKYKSWGETMEGYLCGDCGKPLSLMFAYGPSCPYGPGFGGCGNMPKGYEKRWLSVVETARDLSSAAVEKAAAVVERAKKKVKKRVEDILG